jgi:Ser/Thr protein kinase RdoA (MazF antagonist)
MNSSVNPWGQATQYFYSLTPDVIDQVVRDMGLRPLGRVLALNSLENRVYDVEVSGLAPLEGPFATDSVVVKFYRPGRWSLQTIQEEHSFLRELLNYEVPVVSPLEKNGETLFTHEETGLHYTIFPKVRGRLKDELNAEESTQIGRLIARLHNIGSQNLFQNRIQLNPFDWIKGNAQSVLEKDFIDNDLKNNYQTLVDMLYQQIEPVIQNLPRQRIHGDFHRGNILWTSQGPWITDLDDCVLGCRQQDLWLLFPGRDEWSKSMRDKFLEGYSEMSREPIHVSDLVTESLRTMRLIHFNGWIAKRWDDPIFKQMFTTFATRNYWEQQVLDLKEQMSLIQDAVSSNY